MVLAGGGVSVQADSAFAGALMTDALVIEQTPDGRFLIVPTEVTTTGGVLRVSGERVSIATFGLAIPR
jgi:hypothetical protein